MANSKMIFTCEGCDQLYCGECSDASEWSQFCSRACQKEDGVTEPEHGYKGIQRIGNWAFPIGKRGL